MPWDIYGNELRRGYCEVHPWVEEEYPCSLCYAEKKQRDCDQKARREQQQQSENYELIEICKAEIELLKAKAESNGFRAIITFEKI